MAANYCSKFAPILQAAAQARKVTIVDLECDASVEKLCLPACCDSQNITSTRVACAHACEELKRTGVDVRVRTGWLFTDGAAKANGKPKCTASWAYQWLGFNAHACSGTIDRAFIDGAAVMPSNNRGELYAIVAGLNYIESINLQSIDEIKIISDSMYAIKSIDLWPRTTSTGAPRKNMDMIEEAQQTIARLRTRTKIGFKHTRSHQAMPKPGTAEWFIHAGNDIVDRAANSLL